MSALIASGRGKKEITGKIIVWLLYNTPLHIIPDTSTTTYYSKLPYQHNHDHLAYSNFLHYYSISQSQRYSTL